MTVHEGLCCVHMAFGIGDALEPFACLAGALRHALGREAEAEAAHGCTSAEKHLWRPASRLGPLGATVVFFSRSIGDACQELLCSRQAAPRQQQPMLYTGPGSLHPAGAVVSCPAGGSWPLRLEIMHRQGRVRDEERLATFFSSSLSQGVS